MALTRKPLPRFLTVARAGHISPSMIRVTFAGPELADLRVGCEGANCKIMLPSPGQSLAEFQAMFARGAKPATRTFTVRHYRPDVQELDIDFVDHGDTGPASTWARAAVPGAFLGFMGPSGNKIEDFSGDFWLIAADLSALPIAAATLEQLPADAKGLALFEVPSTADRLELAAPEGIEIVWLEADGGALRQPEAFTARPFPSGRLRTCIAGETGTIRAWKQLLEKDHALPRADLYISGYWKIGLIEDEHQAMKRNML